MRPEEMLRRSLRYEEALLRNYLGYARQADRELAYVFMELMQQQHQRVQKLKLILRKYCPP
ncbi:MAG: hypothetical protein PWP65_69 [Clostridia bacterium]|nr:hypothetical protein [Clostridia bacterium]